MRKAVWTGAAVLGLVIGLAVAPSTAGAWVLSKSTNGMIIEKEASDSTTRVANVKLYYGYKGGDEWSLYGSGYSPNYVSSYNYMKQYWDLAGGSGEAVELVLVPGYRCQMVYLADGVVSKTWAVINEPLNVAWSGSPTVTVGAMPPVELSGSPTISVDSTLPVSVAAFGVFDSSEISGVAGVLAFALGAITYRAVKARG